MPAVVVVGVQWGDEGKGKITDFLAQQADIIVRYQGGNNAGHTVVIGGEEFKLHLVPSGIFYPEKLCIIGNGTVIDPQVLLTELEELEKRGVRTNNLRISPRAHVILSYHRLLDRCEEEKKGQRRIGTTCRGIGPAYTDKVARIGIRVAEFVDEEEFPELLRHTISIKNELLVKIYGQIELKADDLIAEYTPYARRMAPYVVDTGLIIADALRAGKRVLFEGAQGTLLDLDHGTYPYVTSSYPVAAGACLGSGIGPRAIDKVVGVAKAYVTRVGEGPFPTEMKDEIGEVIRRKGKEFGTTTGRPRRCGWFDAVVARYAVRINTLTHLAITKLDVLTGFEKIKICTSYRYRGQEIKDFPSSLKILAGCEPVYEEIDGWQENISKVRRWEDLPPAARKYLEIIEELCGVPVAIIGTGPGREDVIVRGPIYNEER